jgi:hypothetical protein
LLCVSSAAHPEKHFVANQPRKGFRIMRVFKNRAPALRIAALLLATIAFSFNPNNPNVRAGVIKTAVAAASDADVKPYTDEYDVTARVARVSLLRGDVQLLRAGINTHWERATLNLPLVEGDTLATGHDAHVEIQVDARNFVRVGEDASLRLVTLRDEGIAFSLEAGTASVRLARFDRDKEYFEVDGPKTTVAAERTGLYRMDVSPNGNVRVTVRDNGQARIYSDTSGFTLRDGKTAQLITNGAEAGDWDMSAAASRDSWDDWTNQRERYLASRLRYENRDRYYDRDVWGAEELDAYGDWVNTNDYGWIWRPRVTVVNNYYNWTPYRYGHWRWCSPYGWTWIADEEWGWAPYHYGRWVNYDNYWCWVPHACRNCGRSWWRPALVAFVYLPTSYGEHVAWYPLGYNQHDPRGRYYKQPVRDSLTPLRAGEIADLQRINPAYQRAVTTLPARDFGAGTGRAQPAAPELARRAVTSDPVRGRLPIAPVNVDANNTGSVSGRTRAGGTGIGAGVGAKGERMARPAVMDSARLPERQMGAGARQPGVALDDELRRARVYRGRDPRSSVSDAVNVNGLPRTSDTGVVARPDNPKSRRSIERPRLENENAGSSEPSVLRPARPRSPDPQDERSARPGVTRETPDEVREQMPRREQPERRERRPLPRPQPEQNAPSAPPIERAAPPTERAAPPPRSEPPAERHERPSEPPPSAPEPSRPVERERPPAAPPAREQRAEPREAPAAHPARSEPARPEQRDQS